jgi:hypothetical protein
MELKLVVAGFAVIYLALIGWAIYEWVNAPMIEEDELDR